MNQDNTTICIVYVDNQPTQIIYNIESALIYMQREIYRYGNIISTITKSVGIVPNQYLNLVNVKMTVLTHNINGMCISTQEYIYDIIEKAVKQTIILSNNNQNVDNIQNTSKCAKTINSHESNIQVHPTKDKYFGKNNDISIDKPKIISTRETHHIPFTANCDSIITHHNKSDKHKIDDEMLKLTQVLTKITGSDLNKSINQLETIYNGVTEEAEETEEAMLDAEINNLKTRANRHYLYNDSDDLISDDLISDDLISDDLISDDLISNDKNKKEYKYVEKENVEIMDNPSDMPDELKSLIDVRNMLISNIKTQALAVEIANSKLNDDMFKKRCDDQELKRTEQKKHENISIFMADKNTYLKIRGKIRGCILNEKNMSPLFKVKYHIISFMEINDLIQFTKIANIEKEYHIFDQLRIVFDIYKKNDSFGNDSDNRDNKCSNETCDDMINNIDSDYLDICVKYFELLENSDNDMVSEKMVHKLLNDNPEFKKVLFREATNTEVFEKDTDMNNYRNNSEYE